MIRNYDEIDILQNSLVILDIDETIITYSPITPTWWNDMKKLYTDDHAYNEWVHIISKHIPYLLDEPEFFKLIERVKNTNSKLIFLTARNKKFTELTIQQLIYCKIPISDGDVFFSDKKGLTVYEIKRKYNRKHIIFVDDKLSNVIDVKKWNPSVKCYHIKHKNFI